MTTFSKETMKDVLYGDAGRLIEDRITDTSRWSVHHEIIFELDGVTYRTHYSEGATEYQDERPWEYDDVVECTPVHQVEKTVMVWQALPA